MQVVRADPNQFVTVEDCEVPQPGPRNVIVKTLKSGICGSDLHTIRQMRSGLIQTRPLVGHEVCGVVADLGAEVETVQVGDRVTIEPLFRCGVCASCAAGRYNACVRREFLLGGYEDRPGGLAEYFEIPAYCIVPLHESLSDEEGALTEPLAVAVHAIKVAQGRYRPSVGVVGAGTIGLAVVAAAVAGGASAVTVVARHPHQREAAIKLGATRVIDVDEAQSEDVIHELLDGDQLPEFVVETVGGDAATINLSLKLVHPGGVISMVGGYWTCTNVDLETFLMKEVRLAPSNCYSSENGRSDFVDAMTIMQSNPSFADTMLTHRFVLGDATKAFQTAFDKSTRSIKVMLNPHT